MRPTGPPGERAESSTESPPQRHEPEEGKTEALQIKENNTPEEVNPN